MAATRGKHNERQQTSGPPWFVIIMVLALMWLAVRSRPQPMPQASAAPTASLIAANQSAAGNNSRNEYSRGTVIRPPANPYNAPSVYDYRGGRTEQFGNSKQYVVDYATLVPLEQMEALVGEERWAALRDLCEQHIASNPDWPTPHFFYAIAIGKLGEIDEAIQRLEAVKKAFPGVFNSIDHWLIRFRASQRQNQSSKGGGKSR